MGTKLTEKQSNAFNKMVEHHVFYYPLNAGNINPYSYWYIKDKRVGIKDVVMRALRNKGLVEFTKGTKFMVASITAKGWEEGRKRGML